MECHIDGLYERLINREAKLALVGLGYVGMPIAGFYNPAHRTKVFSDLKGIYDRKDFPVPEWDY